MELIDIQLRIFMTALILSIPTIFLLFLDSRIARIIMVSIFALLFLSQIVNLLVFVWTGVIHN